MITPPACFGPDAEAIRNHLLALSEASHRYGEALAKVEAENAALREALKELLECTWHAYAWPARGKARALLAKLEGGGT